MFKFAYYTLYKYTQKKLILKKNEE